MIKKLIAFVLSFIPMLLYAQVIVNAQLPPAGMIQKDQLWNLVLINNSKDVQDASVSLNLQDAITGQTVLSAGTRNIILGKGIRVVTIRDIQPVQYNYLSIDLSGNYIPIGSYIACYRVIKKGSKGDEPLADECVRVNISPLSPPLLNTPADKSVLQNTLPQFSWIPPSPLDMFDNLNYEIRIAEVQAGQSPADAILHNTPVYVKTNSKVPFESYPSGYSKLDTGKTYAWQVTARNGLSYAAATEVWTFSFQKDSAKIQNVGSSYILLKRDRDEGGVNYIEGNKLFIKYYSFDKEHEIKARFLNARGKIIKEQKQKIIYGDNFISFELNRHFQRGQVYRIEITDQQNQINTASFSIK